MKKSDLLCYLAARFEFEPLPHYAMIAVALCGEEEPLPTWVRGFVSKLAEDFFDERAKDEGSPKARGTFPTFSFNSSKPSEQWKRAEDCNLFLTDERAALERQDERLEIVEMFEAQQAQGDTDEVVFEKLGEWYGITEDAAKHRYRSIVAPREHMSESVPVALKPDGEIVFRTVKARTSRGP
jgi:hypothetical protein